jgi:AraC-like DNA-binding protein
MSQNKNGKRGGGVDPVQAGIVAERARRNLAENLAQIRNVDDWVAKEAGCSEGWLATCTKMHYGMTPNAILREERYQKIRDVILCHPEATAADVAGRVAPHWNQRQLCNFLRKYERTNFTKLRREVLKEIIRYPDNQPE